MNVTTEATFPGGGWFSTCSTEAWAGDCFSPKTRTFWRSSGSLRKRYELAGCGCALTVLMPNHWHFVVWPERDGDLPTFMQQVTNTHVKRWKEHRHEIGYGHLCQGRYKCFPVETEDYFYQVVRYVERNALRANLVKRAESWRWSSRVCAVWSAKTRRFPSSRRGLCHAPPIGCKLSTNRK